MFIETYDYPTIMNILLFYQILCVFIAVLSFYNAYESYTRGRDADKKAL